MFEASFQVYDIHLLAPACAYAKPGAERTALPERVEPQHVCARLGHHFQTNCIQILWTAACACPAPHVMTLILCCNTALASSRQAGQDALDACAC